MKVIALKDFEFYIIPEVKNFNMGDILESPKYSIDRLKSMMNNGYVKEVLEMENKMFNKDFKPTLSNKEAVQSVALDESTNKVVDSIEDAKDKPVAKKTKAKK